MMRKKTVKRKAVKKNAKSISCCPTESCGGASGAIYGLGFIGALVYFLSTATGFWVGVWGIIKAALWPAFLVFELFRFLLA
jgi:hypothetical protein